MLSTNKLRSIYSKIQTQLFYMIPEKWEKIFLYASIIEQVNHLETGEMFFYYYPAGLLKRNPVNVYEVPNKFNIDEEEYLKLVDKLYSTFSELRKAFKESTEEKMWTNLTIIIENNKFNVEYSYDDLIGSKYTSYDRHIIWKCKYLDFPLERLTKKDRKMVEEYNSQRGSKKSKTKVYTEDMYKKKIHNIVEYNTDKAFIRDEQREEEKKVKQIKSKYQIEDDEEDDDERLSPKEIKKIERQKEREKQKELEEKKRKEEIKQNLKRQKELEKQKELEAKQNMKNQILNV